MERVSSVVEWQTHNRETLGSNPPLHVQAAEVQYMESDRSFHSLNRLCHHLLLFWSHHENGMRHVRQVHRLLQHLGEGDLRTSKVQDAEEFVCKLYLVENFTKIDEASEKLFNKWKTFDALPPATDGCKSPISEPDLEKTRQRYHPINICWLESRKWTPCCQTINATTCTKSM